MHWRAHAERIIHMALAIDRVKMGSEYETTFNFSTDADVQFICELFSEMSFTDEPIQGEISIKTPEPISLAHLVEVKHDGADVDDIAVGDGGGADLELDVEPEEVPLFREGSSTPVILRTILNGGPGCVKLREIRDSCESDMVNEDNLSRLLYSFAESGYLQKQKDGGLNEYCVTDYGKAALRKFEQAQDE